MPLGRLYEPFNFLETKEIRPLTDSDSRCALRFSAGHEAKIHFYNEEFDPGSG